MSKIPSYTMIPQSDGKILINFVCDFINKPIAAILNDGCIYPDQKTKIDVSFSENTIKTYDTETIDKFEEQIGLCIFDTLEKIAEERSKNE